MADKKNKDVLLNDLYKNAHTALQSISDTMPALTADNKIKEELIEEYEQYEKYLSDLSAFMKDSNIERKDINPIKKAMMWGAVKMNTMTDTSDNHIADIMLQGTLMGITDLRTMVNGTDGEIDIDVKRFADTLLKLEETNEKNLKKFL